MEVEQQEDIQKIYSIHIASGSERGRGSKNDREDVDQEVPVSDIAAVLLNDFYFLTFYFPV